MGDLTALSLFSQIRASVKYFMVICNACHFICVSFCIFSTKYIKYMYLVLLYMCTGIVGVPVTDSNHKGYRSVHPLCLLYYVNLLKSVCEVYFLLC